MAMDSHNDNQYELLNDTINNNRNEKASISQELNKKAECSLFSYSPVSLDSFRVEGSGSARRKHSSLSKGITIEEFLESEDTCQLTAIDKLILKNKAALALDQMKRTRLKSSKETTSAVTLNKKESNRKNGNKKVVFSKVGNNKRINTEFKKPSTSNGTTKCNGDLIKLKSNLKSKNGNPISREYLEKQRNSRSVLKNEKSCLDDNVRNNAKLRSQKKTSDTNRRETTGDRRCFSSQKKLLKRRNLTTVNKNNTNNKKPLELKRLKTNVGPLELKRLKTNVGYQTRSGNKEKLRNGKTRIFKDVETLALQPTKRFKRNDGNIIGAHVSSLFIGTTASPTCSRSTLKRTIIEESSDDLDLSFSKRKKTEEFGKFNAVQYETNNNNNDVNINLKTQRNIKNKDVYIELDEIDENDEDICSNHLESKNIKIEQMVHVKQELNDPQNNDVVEININMNIPVSQSVKKASDIEFVCDNIKSESISLNFFDDKLVSNGPTQDTSNSINNMRNILELDGCEKPTELVSTEDSDAVKTDGFNHKTIKSVNDQSSEISKSTTHVETSCTSKNNFDTEKSQSARCNENNLDKESMFNALGLQSIEKINQKSKEREKEVKENWDKESYTGTLKAIIKTDKGCRRMEMKQKESCPYSGENMQKENILSFYSKTIQDRNLIGNPNKSSLNNTNSTDTSNDSSGIEPLYIDDESDKNEGKICQPEVPLLTTIKDANLFDKECNRSSDSIKDKNKITEPLVVPEKSSSFSIHPDRLCSDVCKYCFGKFGTLDTPCHVAQLKNPERQRKILMCEPNLKMDTCLCDACFRFVDRKANRPPIKRKSIRRSMTQRTLCAVQNCNQLARHYGNRKWRLKIGKKIANLSFDVTRRGSRMSFGLCSQHFYMVDLCTLCGICKKRLNRNDMYSIRSELNDLNEVLKEDGIPINLIDNMLLCKYCHHCMSLRLKYGNSSNMSPSNQQYYQSFRKEILGFYNVIVSDSEDTNSSEGQKYESGDTSSPERLKPNRDEQAKESFSKPDSSGKRVENKMNNHNVDIQEIANLLKPLEADHSNDKNSTRIQLKFGNLNIGKLSNLNIGQNTQAEPKKKEESTNNNKELPLIADFNFENNEQCTKNWEKCVSTILFDKGTKRLWQDLQKPYGNQSSFIRHLIMLEKYWRSGALVLADNADAGAAKYINSVKNRVESLETSSKSKIISKSSHVQPSSSTISAVKLPTLPSLTLPTLQPAPIINRPPQMISITTPPQPPPMVRIMPKPSSSGVTVGSELSSRHASTPPPLLKLNSVSSPFTIRKTPVSNLKSSSDHCLQMAKSSTWTNTSQTPSPPILERMTSNNCIFVNKIPVTLKQYKEMMNVQPRSKQLMQVNNTSGHVLGMSLIKKPTVNGNRMSVPSSTVTINFPSKQFASPLMKSEYNSPQSMLIAKLPKALTVTQVDDVVIKEKAEMKPPPLIASPFLVGEKPSVSVFREIPKEEYNFK